MLVFPADEALAALRLSDGLVVAPELVHEGQGADLGAGFVDPQQVHLLELALGRQLLLHPVVVNIACIFR